MTTLLAVKGVTKVFGGLTAVDSVDLEIAESSIASLIGPNGAGKTTLFNCLTGLHRPEAGEILLSGRSLVGCARMRSRHAASPAPIRTFVSSAG